MPPSRVPFPFAILTSAAALQGERGEWNAAAAPGLPAGFTADGALELVLR